jgi:hypothetical protein
VSFAIRGVACRWCGATLMLEEIVLMLEEIEIEIEIEISATFMFTRLASTMINAVGGASCR